MAKPKRSGGHVMSLAATLAPLDDIACLGPRLAEPALWYAEFPVDIGIILRRAGVHLFSGLPPRNAFVLGAMDVRERLHIVGTFDLYGVGLNQKREGEATKVVGAALHSAAYAADLPEGVKRDVMSVSGGKAVFRKLPPDPVVKAGRAIWRCVVALPDPWWEGDDAPPVDDMVPTAAILGVEIPETVVGIWREAAADLALTMRQADRAQPIDGRAWAPARLMSAAERNVTIGKFIADMAAGLNPELPEGIAEPDKPISPTARTVIAVPKAIRRE
jgi:hypothetical protein